MSFADPTTLKRRLARAAKRPYATVEVGHADFANGLIVKIDLLTSHAQLETIIAGAHELAALYPVKVQRLSDPGWWAGVICEASNRAGYPAAMVRGKGLRSRLHACVVVAHGSMLDVRPSYPQVRLGLTGLRDLRGEAAMAAGPTRADFDRYRELDPTIDVSDEAMLALFDQGVLVWGANEKGELCVTAAGRKGL